MSLSLFFPHAANNKQIEAAGELTFQHYQSLILENIDVHIEANLSLAEILFNQARKNFVISEVVVCAFPLNHMLCKSFSTPARQFVTSS